MRICLFTPRIHFHVPVVLRRLFRELPESCFRLYVTPKLESLCTRSTTKVRRLVDLIRTSGLDYVAAMTWTHAALSFFQALGRVAGGGQKTEYDSQRVACCFGVPAFRVSQLAEERVQREIESFAPDWLVAIFFNQIIPPHLLSLAGTGAINVHPSFLPSYRGMSPCFWALAEGAPVAGATIHRLGPRIDRGEILARRAVAIRRNESVFSLYRRCASLAAELLIEVLRYGRSTVERFPVRSCYRSRITPNAVRSLRRRGHRFFLLP